MATASWRRCRTGLSRDWGDEDANDMTGRDVTVPIGCKTHPRPRSLSRQQPVQSYRLRPHPPNLWTVPSPANHEGVRSRTHAAALRLEAADRQAAAAVVVGDGSVKNLGQAACLSRADR